MQRLYVSLAVSLTLLLGSTSVLANEATETPKPPVEQQKPAAPAPKATAPQPKKPPTATPTKNDDESANARRRTLKAVIHLRDIRELFVEVNHQMEQAQTKRNMLITNCIGHRVKITHDLMMDASEDEKAMHELVDRGDYTSAIAKAEAIEKRLVDVRRISDEVRSCVEGVPPGQVKVEVQLERRNDELDDEVQVSQAAESAGGGIDGDTPDPAATVRPLAASPAT